MKKSNPIDKIKKSERNKLTGRKLLHLRENIHKTAMVEQCFKMSQQKFCEKIDAKNFSVKNLSNMEKIGIRADKMEKCLNALETCFGIYLGRKLFECHELKDDAEIIRFVTAQTNMERDRILEMCREHGIVRRYQLALEKKLEAEIGPTRPISLYVEDEQENEYVLDTKTVWNHTHAILEGKAGSGKTTVFKKLVFDILKNREGMIPVLVDVSRKSDILEGYRCDGAIETTVNKLLSAIFLELGLGGGNRQLNSLVTQFIKNVSIQSEKLIVLFDGYDELNGNAASGQKARFLQLVNLLNEYNRKETWIKVWIATRPTSGSEFANLNPVRTLFRLKQLNDLQKTNILRIKYENSELDVQPEVFLNHLRDNPITDQLSRNPLMLSYLVLLPRQRPSDRKNRTDVLRAVVDYHLKNRNPESNEPVFSNHKSDYNDKLEMLSHLAFDLTFTFDNRNFEEQKAQESLGDLIGQKFHNTPVSLILGELIETGLIQEGYGQNRLWLFAPIQDYLVANHLRTRSAQNDPFIQQMIQTPKSVAGYLDILVLLSGCHDRPWFIESMIEAECRPEAILECLGEIHDSSRIKSLLERKSFLEKVEACFRNIDIIDVYPYLRRLAPELMEIFENSFTKRQKKYTSSIETVLLRYLRENTRQLQQHYNQFKLINQKAFIERLIAKKNHHANGKEGLQNQIDQEKKIRNQLDTLYQELYDFVSLFFAGFTSATRNVYGHSHMNKIRYAPLKEPKLTETEKEFVKKYLLKEDLQKIIDYTNLNTWNYSLNKKARFRRLLQKTMHDPSYEEEDYRLLYNWLSCREIAPGGLRFHCTRLTDKKNTVIRKNLIILIPSLNIDPARLQEDENGSLFQNEDMIQDLMEFLLDQNNEYTNVLVYVIGNGKVQQNRYTSNYFGFPAELGNHEGCFLYIWLVFLYKVIAGCYPVEITLKLLLRFLKSIIFEEESTNSIEGFYLTLAKLDEKGLFSQGKKFKSDKDCTFFIFRPSYLARRSLLELECCIDHIKKQIAKDRQRLKFDHLYYPDSSASLLRKDTISDLFNSKYQGREFPGGKEKLTRNLVHEMIRIIQGFKFQKPYFEQSK